MIAGIEGRHSWNSGAVLLNDLSSATWPKFEILSIAGLKSLGEGEDLRDPIPGRRGETPRPSVRRGKTASYEIEILGRTLLEMRQGEDTLLAAFDEFAGEGRMDVTHVAGTIPSRFFKARPTRCEIADQQIGKRWARVAALVLRLSDPRVFDPAQAGPHTTGAVAAMSGATLPITPPVILPAGTAQYGEVTFTPNGKTDSDPEIKIFGPIRNPEIENFTRQRKLVFRELSLLAGETLTIDFAARTIVLTSGGIGVDARSTLDLAYSSWWDEGEKGLAPVAQTIRLFGEGMTNGTTKAEIRYYPADPA